MDTSIAVADSSADDRLTGSVIAGRYRVEERIGSGQMARVYRARHVRLSRWFAVKVLPGPMASEPISRLRFAQEADAASRLDHPNVVPVVDFGRVDSGELYLVMELVQGETLGSLIEREAPLAPRRAIELARSLARGLGHAHQRGLVHRDFKPDNVVLDGAVPRILDFGLALRPGRDDDDGEPRLTEQGFVVGTPIYLSPEQACDEPVDARADLYALGVVLYEMLAGRPPFEGTASEVARRKLVEPVPPIARVRPDVTTPPALESLVMRLLAHDPEDRFASASDLVAALDALEPELLRAQPDELERSPSRARRWPRIAIATLAAAAALSLRASEPPPPPAAMAPLPAPLPPVVSPVAIAAPLGPPSAPPPRPAARPSHSDRAHLAREYREVGEALDRLHQERGAAAAAPLEARYLRLPYADSLRVPSLGRETLRRLAAIRREIRAAR
jgi:serine/threonine-protein kinase